MLAATILATAAVVAAGPIAFIALAAPHLTRKIFKSSRPLILPTALVGASLLLFSDLLARFLPMQSALPVGVFTAGVGGLYLLYLIFSERK
nr:iron chelate uptake ABC transporter family permease subunit [Neisseria chenwenguii]